MLASEPFEAWDPLDAHAGADPGMIVAAQKREIANILKSYTGYYDIFNELIQNALDAVEHRSRSTQSVYQGFVKIDINLQDQSVTVSDNGCGMDLSQFRQFLRPSFSFKTGNVRGCKGVGATYLAYGFNSLRVTTTVGGQIYSGVLERGRDWIDDTTGTVARPRIVHAPSLDPVFEQIDRGTSVKVTLLGQNIRPRNLGWSGATTAAQWLVLLRLLTPIGGIYLGSSQAPAIDVEVNVVDGSGELTSASLPAPTYLYPHSVVTRSGDLRDFLVEQAKRTKAGIDPGNIPPKYTKLNGIWGQWPGDQIIGDVPSDCPIQPRLTEDEKKLARELRINIYIYLAFSTDLWDSLSDKNFALRKGSRVIRGGLQLATKNMAQGMPLTIPMTNNIGFQNLAHIILHMDNAEPDLGRKGFQPEHVQLAEKIAVSAVTAFRRRYHLLRKPGVAKIFGDELKIQEWIKLQERHELDNALTIKGVGLFLPTEELPIRSEPLVEQDVVALFNQMLSSGLVRGVQLISSSQYKQYDGLFRISMDPPYDKYIYAHGNPLGVDEEFFSAHEGALKTSVKVLEYKYTVDGLIEELQSEVKSTEDIGLVVAWDLGAKWKEMFDITSYLDPDNSHHRRIHGTTHSFTHSMSGAHAFEAIILRDLVNFLKSPEEEIVHQRELADPSLS